MNTAGAVTTPPTTVTPERRQRCGILRAFRDNHTGRGVMRRLPCNNLGCTWCRQRLDDEGVIKYRPAEPTDVARYVVPHAGLSAFTTRVRRHGGQFIQIPGPGDTCVVLVHGDASGEGETVDAELALVDALEARPADGRKISKSAGWMELTVPADTVDVVAEEADDPGPFDPFTCDDTPFGPRFAPLGTVRRGVTSTVGILKRHRLDPRINYRRGGEVLLSFDLPPEDSFEYVLLLHELFD